MLTKKAKEALKKASEARRFIDKAFSQKQHQPGSTGSWEDLHPAPSQIQTESQRSNW